MQEKKLREEIIDKIKSRGAIPVDEFMSLALTKYYSSNIPFGRKGDFTTAPEVSQMFGEMIAVCLIDFWQKIGSPQNVKLVELGPGLGTLMADVMRVASKYCNFEIHLVEISPVLREEQRKKLDGYNVHWHSEFSSVPKGLTFVIANEFLDALPVKQFMMSEHGWCERLVSYNQTSDNFELVNSDVITDINIKADIGAIKELSSSVDEAVTEVADRINEHGGLAIFIDYGYKEDACGDTIQAVSKHGYVNWLENPGECDITAHINFASLNFKLKRAVNIYGAITQGEFLKSLGIELRCASLVSSVSAAEAEILRGEMRRLISPDQMGDLFKVMAITSKNFSAVKPEGF